jgi:hypothetical protein
MNAVEIEEAISALAERRFDADEFPYSFLEAFGNKETTLKRLRRGESNRSDLGGVLQTNNIHIAVAAPGEVTKTLAALKTSPATARAKAKFILATDGETFEAEDLASGETVACAYADFPDHFGFFLPLAGITTVRQIAENAFDIRATSRLNKLYVELLKDNPEWGTAARRHDMNHFMARLIFCFFAEDTDIFNGGGLFTATIEQMSNASNTDYVIGEIFRAMNTPTRERATANLRPWANVFPYVNGGLFSGSLTVPRFSRIARSYLLHIGNLDWRKINPDIFGSMIQAVAEDEERGALGLHYTSVPNILKVLNPLFLDELWARLDEAGDNPRTLLNLRRRLARIRVFDPACGSGNFLVIAYKEMRAIEAEINKRRHESGRKSDIPLTNFRGIELRDFPAEIARLALIIAEFQCDVLYRGQKEALAEFLPLDSENWITCGNALRLDWLSTCPPTGTAGGKIFADDLFGAPLDQAQIDFQNEGGETYICGNPPYRGSKWQDEGQKADLARAWSEHPQLAKTTDFVSGWIAAYLKYARSVPDAMAAFVATNSMCQGQQASEIWPIVTRQGREIRFAHTPFTWKNLASHNAGVTVIIIGLGPRSSRSKRLFGDDNLVRECEVIGPYLVPNMPDSITKANRPLGRQATMLFGNMPRDGGHLFLTTEEARELRRNSATSSYVRRFLGSDELINGKLRFCLWIEDGEAEGARTDALIANRLALVADNRRRSPAESTRAFADLPHRFVQIADTAQKSAIVVPRVSSENRDYLPADLVTGDCIIGDRNFALYDAPLWNMALIVSRLHWVWIGTVCVRMRTDFSYSNTLGWKYLPGPASH